MSFIDKMFGGAFKGLQRTMDLTWQRNEAIVSNIANAETPQYRAVDLSFGNELEKAFNQANQSLKLSDPKHMDIHSASGARLESDLSGATKPDGNNVDIDIQMGQLTFNAGQYSLATDVYRKKLGLLKLALRDTR